MPFIHEALGLRKDTEKAVSESQADSPSVCPITRLPITQKPEWNDIQLDGDYRLTLSVLGNNILLAKASGYATLSGLKKAVTHLDKAVNEALPEGRPFVSIENYAELRGASHEARQFFIEYQKGRKALLALVFCGVSNMFKLSIKLGTRLNIVDFETHIAEDYAEAVKTALMILADDKAKIDDRSGNRALKPFLKAQEKLTPKKKPVQNSSSFLDGEVCPVSGLPITRRSEWTDIELGEVYTVTFMFIGDRILHSFSQGKAGEHGIENLFKERKKVLCEMLGTDEPFFELRDYSAITGGVTKKSRDQLVKGMRESEERTIGWIGYKASTTVRLSVNVGRKLHKPDPSFRCLL